MGVEGLRRSSSRRDSPESSGTISQLDYAISRYWFNGLDRLVLLQSWRRLGEGAADGLGRYVQVANFEAGVSTGEWLVYRGRVLGEGGMSRRLRDFLLDSFKWIEGRGYVPEIHLSNCWVLGGGPVSYDLVIDLEPDELRVQLERASSIIRYLRMYGVKAACKLSSVRDGVVGLHVYADLHVLWRLGLEEGWECFYEALLKHLSRVYNIPMHAMDPAFKHKHNFRAFNSPRAEKGDPATLNCFNVPIRVEDYLELGGALGWDAALEALRAEAQQPSRRIPWTGLLDAEGFLALYEALSSVELGEEARREARARVLEYRHRLYRSNPKVRWIERVLDRGLEDGRKRFVYMCAAPYLAQLVKRNLITVDEALERLMMFNERSSSVSKRRPLSKTFLRGQLNWSLRNDRRPLSIRKFLELHPDLRELLQAALKPEARGERSG